MKVHLKINLFIASIGLLLLTVYPLNNYGALPASPGEVTIQVSYTKGSANFSSSIVYVIWVENESKNYIQNLYICNSILGIGKTLTGTALPYWKMNKYPDSEVDGVTGATQKNTDFSVTKTLADNTIRQFKIYMEVDHSFDSNDWFNDQPALLYSTTVDLDNLQAEYTFNAVGWTRNDNESGSTSNKFKDDPPHTSPTIGQLQSELRYITNTMVAGTFGGEYTDNTAATNIVGSLKAVITVTADNTPPSVPTNLTGKAASGSVINLTWTASTDNVGVTGYRISRTGHSSHVATSSTNSFSDTGLTELKQYSYTVTAYDLAGNESDPCTAIQVTTLPADTVILVDQVFENATDTCIGALQNLVIAGDGNNVLFQSGSAVNLIAGNSIRLLPGSQVQEGATFNASITADSTFCETSASPVISNNSNEKAIFINASDQPTVNGLKDKLVKIYPNPANGRFTIELSNFLNQVTVSVINIQGTIIYPQQIIQSTPLAIDLSTRSKGIYIVRISDGEMVINKRIILR
jgi:hypothetical protein